MRHWQFETRPMLGGEERIEQPIDIGRGDAMPVVDDVDGDPAFRWRPTPLQSLCLGSLRSH
jgi:hypothetical protein